MLHGFSRIGRSYKSTTRVSKAVHMLILSCMARIKPSYQVISYLNMDLNRRCLQICTGAKGISRTRYALAEDHLTSFVLFTREATRSCKSWLSLMELWSLILHQLLRDHPERARYVKSTGKKKSQTYSLIEIHWAWKSI